MHVPARLFVISARMRCFVPIVEFTGPKETAAPMVPAFDPARVVQSFVPCFICKV